MPAYSSEPPAGSLELARRHRRESAARTYSRRLPIVVAAGEGVHVRDTAGRTYLDCLAGAGALALGHGHPVVVEALLKTLRSGVPLTTLDLATPQRDEFVEALFAVLPASLRGGRIQFCGPTGSDAVEAAVKLARTATGRSGVIAFGGAYHGMTQGALELSGAHAPKAPLGELGSAVHHLPFPTAYRCPFGAGGERGAELCARALRWALTDTHSGILPPAAIIAEPVQGEGGVHAAPAAFARAVRTAATGAGAVVIADEVQTGLGRTGTLWASGDLDPDVLVLSKAIGGGQPLAVIVYRAELDVWEPGAHAGTFRGNALGFAAGAATIRHIADNGLAEHAAAMGERLLAALREQTEGLPVVGDVRGRGLMIGVELVDPDRTDEDGVPAADGALAAAVQRALLAPRRARRERRARRGGDPLPAAADHRPRRRRPHRRRLRQGGVERVEGRVSQATEAIARDALVSADPLSHAALRAHALAVADAVAEALAAGRPCSGADAAAVARAIEAIDPCPEDGLPFADVLAGLRDDVLAHGVVPSDPRCAAHLQPPTLAAAAAAELAIGATNQSLDSFEQSPAATLVEDRLVRWLAQTLGLRGGSGVLTSGGTAANLLGLLLAREQACERLRGRREPGAGLPPQAARWRIVTSAAAHDSVRRGAHLLGLGTGAVVGVATDAAGRIDVDALDATLDALERAGLVTIAIVATAGTTDLGAIDPLAQIAVRARERGAWLHVDAAVGSALALSERLAGLLDGIEQADSITADLHKLWFMPIGASALLVRDVALLAAVNHHSDYLNRAEDEADGTLNLVGRSLDTSRRFDALKILAGLRTTGRRRLAAMVEQLVELARRAGELVGDHDELELLAPPSTVMVAFRWRPAGARADEDAVDDANVAAQRELLRSGRAVVGRTRLDGRVALKLTLVNPLATEDDIRELLALVARTARAAYAGPARARGAAVAAATETLLNCYLREGGAWRAVPAADAPALARSGDTHVAVLALAGGGATLSAGIRHLSATHRHRFRTPVTMAVDGGAPVAVAFDALAGLLVDELAQGRRATDRGAALQRMRASVANVATFLAARDGEIDALWGPEPLSFIASEQALLLGHMLHPTPKSRTEMSARDVADYSPELGARFRLHWLAVDPAIVEHDSATGTPAPLLARRLLRDDPELDGAALDAALAPLGERVLVPAHPWELAHLRATDPAVQALLQRGSIVDLGPLGGSVTPTTSVRTVHNGAWPWQLKFSLHVRVTNSERVTLPQGAAPRGRGRAPAADRGRPARGADRAALRDAAGPRLPCRAPRRADRRRAVGAAARQPLARRLGHRRERGHDALPGPPVRRRAAGSARSSARSRSAAAPRADVVARKWFARWCDVVIVPIVRLYAELGLCMEPHAQNIVLELEDGWPARAVYRDSQGYFHREAAHDDITAIVPGIGEASESIFPEALADERLVYYPFLNNALGVVNALGVAGCIDERVLLGDLRVLLERERARAAARATPRRCSTGCSTTTRGRARRTC